MGNISGDMKSLCEDITTGHADRTRGIKDLRKQAEAIRDDARKFVSHARELHEEMAKDLRKNLLENKEELVKNVKSLRQDFKKKEKEIKTDLAEASKIWNNLSKTLESKKTKSK
jgi:predicted  nucleic acid-binding Zn-ribbon protein